MTKHPARDRDCVASESEAGAPEATFSSLAPEPPCALTLRMVGAGVNALDRYRDSYSDGLLVEAIYSAMHAQRKSR